MSLVDARWCEPVKHFVRLEPRDHGCLRHLAFGISWCRLVLHSQPGGGQGRVQLIIFVTEFGDMTSTLFRVKVAYRYILGACADIFQERLRSCVIINDGGNNRVDPTQDIRRRQWCRSVMMISCFGVAFGSRDRSAWMPWWCESRQPCIKSFSFRLRQTQHRFIIVDR